MWPRELLPDERHMLEVLLSRPFAGRDELREQLTAISVTGLSCECGCPSLALSVERVAPPAPAKGLVADGVGVDADGNLVGVHLLLDDEGYMADLDVYAFGGMVDGRVTKGAWGKPTPESFELAELEPDPSGHGYALKNLPGRG
jgi:hypothetical protein